MSEPMENEQTDFSEWIQHFSSFGPLNTEDAERFISQHRAEFGDLDRLGLVRAWSEAVKSFCTDPHAVMKIYGQFWQDSLQLWQHSMQRMLGQDSEFIIEEQRGDRRFRNDKWSEDVYFSHLKQAYLLTARMLLDTVTSLKNMDEQEKLKLDFYTRQMTDAAAPNNFLFSNPDVIQATINSRGENLVNGWNNMVQDWERGNGKLQIKMTDFDAFELGKNIAVTPGEVVYQNRMMQLIQYYPTGKQVYKKPLLIMPPWINKYYVVDMQQENSLVKWLVDQGHSVFIISWINPDASYADVGFEEYLIDGAVEAVNIVRDISGQPDVNAVGYCLGGTLLASALAWLKGKDERSIASATFLASMIDFSEPGELQVFIDEEQIAKLETEMEKDGYLDGSSMANSFGMLRANDLIWSFVINNYLMGKDPRAFDLLYWNADSTRMPAKMHSYYLRKMYLENALREPGGIELAGVPIDINRVDVPVYFISALDDHIAPWSSTYSGAKIFSGPVRFVLGESGHIAGIINPPAAKKYGYFTRSGRMPSQAETWLKGAKHHDGSWWPDWQSWVSRLNKEKVAARKIDNKKYPPLQPAPGEYVKERIVKID